jgi:hypothetical protein
MKSALKAAPNAMSRGFINAEDTIEEGVMAMAAGRAERWNRSV